MNLGEYRQYIFSNEDRIRKALNEEEQEECQSIIRVLNNPKVDEKIMKNCIGALKIINPYINYDDIPTALAVMFATVAETIQILKQNNLITLNEEEVKE